MSFRRNLKVSLAAKVAESRQKNARIEAAFAVLVAAGNPDHCGTGTGGGRFTDAEHATCEGGAAGVPVPPSTGGPNGEVTQVGGVPVADWRKNHGISEEAMKLRGYTHWDKTGTGNAADGLDPQITAAYGSDPSAISQMRNASAQSSGLVMPRHAIPGSPFEVKEILPQTRPDAPILSSGLISDLRKSGITREVLDDPGNAELRTLLMKDKSKKVVLDHDLYYTDDKGKKRIYGSQGDVVTGLGAKYLFPAGDGNAARVDLPQDPENVKNFVGNKGRVWIAMEGALKTDAVFTALKASGKFKEGDSVIGIPSVTLWHKADLQKVNDKIKLLQGTSKGQGDTNGISQLEAEAKDLKGGGASLKKRISDISVLQDKMSKLSDAQIQDKFGQSREEVLADHEKTVNKLEAILADPDKRIAKINSDIATKTGKIAALEAFKKVAQDNGSEMEWTIKNHLQGREVVLIPDADGIANPNVRNQARALQNLISTNDKTGKGRVIVAAPPVPRNDDGSPKTRIVQDEYGNPKLEASVYTRDIGGGKVEKLKGVDDYLGAGKGKLEDMTYEDRVPAKVNLYAEQVKRLQEGGKAQLFPSAAGARTAEATLRALSMMADPKSGEVRVGLRTIASAMGGSTSNVDRSLGQLVALGILKREDGLDIAGTKREKELIDRGVLSLSGVSRTKVHSGLTPMDRARIAGRRAPNAQDRAAVDDNEAIIFEENNPSSPVYTIVNPKYRAVTGPVTTVGGQDGVKYVRTQAGALKYGQSIGELISADDNANS